jgi:hypothetical protein
MGWRIKGLNPGKEKIHFPSPEYLDRCWGHCAHSSVSTGYRNNFPGVNRLGCEDDHSPPSGDEVKNDCSYTSTPSTGLPSVDRGTFTSFYNQASEQ